MQDMILQLAISFQPTPSARRVTLIPDQPYNRQHISTHTLRKEGDLVDLAEKQTCTISTHTLRKEGDSY